ncbi:MAG TPA: hypothetical protein VJT09_04300 [Pyrinomonadaceae bacterium]|nr:hypothetical protein [Pyrinomonadaceae bacterium]
MRILKTKALSTLAFASLALLLSACGGTGNTSTTTTNTSTTNTSKANTTVTANSNQATVSNTNASSNTAQTPAGESEDTEIQGKLQVGKTESVILYVGMESGDYAGYCFMNDSEAGRAIMAACKDGEQCEVKGTVEAYKCKVPGLEADLSDSGRITKVTSAKSHGRKK